MGNAFWRLGHGNDCDDGYIPGYGGLSGLARSRHKSMDYAASSLA